MPYVTSTMSTDVQYTKYAESEANGANTPIAHVIVKGGSGVANKKLAVADGVLTPFGVQTKIDNDEAQLLEENETFRKHRDAGYVKIHAMPVAAGIVARDMEERDKSAPIRPEDLTKSGMTAKDNAIQLARVE